MTTLLLVRHATTPATGHRLGGWTPGIDLDEQGRHQAEVLADRLGVIPISAVYASPLERTVQTARPIARRHGLRVRVRRAFGEVDFGTWTNLPLHQLRRRRAWGIVQHTPSRMTFPGGESLRAAQARAVDGIEELAVAHPDTSLVVVSHADIIKAVLAHYLGMGLDMFQRLVIDPASVSVLDVPAGASPTVRGINLSELT